MSPDVRPTDEALSDVESDDFAIRVLVASALATAVRITTRSDEFRGLRRALAVGGLSATAVGTRIEELALLSPPAGYLNSADAAILAMLLALEDVGGLALVRARRAVLGGRGLFWSRHYVTVRFGGCLPQSEASNWSTDVPPPQPEPRTPVGIRLESGTSGQAWNVVSGRSATRPLVEAA